MKIKTLAILFSCVAAPVALFASSDNPSPANDRKIEAAAKPPRIITAPCLRIA